MNILITGAKGFVGRNLVENLKNIKEGKDRTHPDIRLEDIMEYDIDRQYKLIIGGTSGGKPMYIRLVLVEDIDTYIDIRTEDLEEFIARTEGS